MKKEELYETMAQIDDQFIQEANTIQLKKNQPNRMTWIAAAACLCCLAVGITLLSLSQKKTTVKPGTADHETSGSLISTDETIEDVFHSIQTALVEWENKTISEELFNLLKEAKEDETIEIAASPYVDYDFSYQGKTLGEYYKAMADLRIMPEVLTQLLKEGDSLKYGEALCTSGDQDGIKWDENFYHERIEFYGEELLSHYLVNGEFLKDQLNKDRAALEGQIEEATMAYKDCRQAYLESVSQAFLKPAQAEIKGDFLVLYMTRAEFAAFNPEKVEAWAFRLAKEQGKVTTAAAE